MYLKQDFCLLVVLKSLLTRDKSRARDGELLSKLNALAPVLSSFMCHALWRHSGLIGAHDVFSTFLPLESTKNFLYYLKVQTALNRVAESKNSNINFEVLVLNWFITIFLLNYSYDCAFLYFIAEVNMKKERNYFSPFRQIFIENCFSS